MIRIRHYDLQVQPQFADPAFVASAPGQALVQARLTVVNDGAEPIARIPLVLYRLYTVSDIAVDGQPVAVTQQLTMIRGMDRHHVNAITIDLPQPLAPGAACSVALKYGGVTAGAREVWPYIWDTVSRAYTLLRPDILWYPLPAEPVLEELNRAAVDEATFSLTVQVPEGLTAVAAGKSDVQGDLVRFENPEPRWRLDLAVAPFTRLEAGGLSIYHLPESAEWGQAALRWVKTAQAGLTERLGPRAADGLSIVQVPNGWGSQHSPGLILQEAGDASDWFSASCVVHEVSHSWTPKPVTPGDRFSDESLAHYFEAVILGDLFGPEVFARRLERYQRWLDRTPEAHSIGLLRACDYPALAEGLFRSKGPLALEALRLLMGDGPFWALLRAYTAPASSSAATFVGLVQEYLGPEAEVYRLDRWFR